MDERGRGGACRYTCSNPDAFGGSEDGDVGYHKAHNTESGDKTQIHPLRNDVAIK